MCHPPKFDSWIATAKPIKIWFVKWNFSRNFFALLSLPHKFVRKPQNFAQFYWMLRNFSDEKNSALNPCFKWKPRENLELIPPLRKSWWCRSRTFLLHPQCLPQIYAVRRLERRNSRTSFKAYLRLIMAEPRPLIGQMESPQPISSALINPRLA